MRRRALLLALFAVSSAPALAVVQGGQDPGVDREAMWFAPTAEDWTKPCLIAWQRTWEDALAVAEETGQAILICVNMDGEIASEHYAGVRYRQPEIAALYAPYVTVVASVYRHTPRDHDEEGRRIPCPRFGTVTCGEHIAIEPILYEKYFEGTRVAPRHIMIELDGAEQYDVFYAWDTASVFQAVRDAAIARCPSEWPAATPRTARRSRPLSRPAIATCSARCWKPPRPIPTPRRWTCCGSRSPASTWRCRSSRSMRSRAASPPPPWI
jgi:hypothetical protein